MKKILTLSLILVLLFSITSCGKKIKKAQAEDFEYEQIEGGIILTKYIGDKTRIKVKNSYDGYNVWGITKDTFRDNDNLEAIILPGVLTIPEYAFEGCENLNYVKFRSGNTYIKEYAFKGCTALEEIKISGTVEEIDEKAFIDCPNLKHFKAKGYFGDKKNKVLYHKASSTLVLGGALSTIPKVVTKINDYAFYGRSELTQITIPEYITEVGVNAFGGCQNLKTIKVDKNNKVLDSRDNSNAIIISNEDKLIQGCANTIIPTGIKTIGTNAFCNFDNLTGITIPQTVKTIEEDAIYGCKNLEIINVNPNNPTYDSRDSSNALIETTQNRLITACNKTVIPTSIKTIASNAFTNTTNLTSIVIPDGVENIMDHAFSNLQSLKSISISKTVTSIGKNIFSGSNNLEEIKVSSDNQIYNDGNNKNCIINTLDQKLIYGIKTTTIPSNITSIGFYAFENVLGLSEIKIPDNIISIGEGAFKNCLNVSVIQLGYKVKTIEKEAFLNCQKVESITIPKSVEKLGEASFGGCNLWRIIVEEGNKIYDSRENCDAVVETSSNALVLGCINTIIPSSVTTIKANAFYGSKIKKINITENITNVEPKAFSHCDDLKEITVVDNHPVYDSRNNSNAIIDKTTNQIIVGCGSTTIDKSVAGIADYAFIGSNSTYKVVIPKTVTYIGEGAFAECENFIYIEITKNVNNVSKDAFYNCPSLLIRAKFKSLPESWDPSWNSSNCTVEWGRL